jgi:hypothetical protein
LALDSPKAVEPLPGRFNPANSAVAINTPTKPSPSRVHNNARLRLGGWG